MVESNLDSLIIRISALEQGEVHQYGTADCSYLGKQQPNLAQKH